MRAPRLRLGTVLEEVFLDRPVAVHGRVMHWAHAISVARVDTGVCCYQQANDTIVTALDRHVKRRIPSELVSHLCISTSLQQCVYNCFVPLLGCCMKR